MNITLSWAMRQSGANAGLVGMIDSDGIRVVTAEGYAADADSDILPSNGNDDHYLDVQLPGISGALQTGQPTTVYKEAANGSFASLLMDAQGQVGIPIRREDEVIGILLLETQSAENFSDDVLAFLSRLGDHAAIAIANAQLYSEVREANLSKSKFVSFVAHELKNPMASIKGYTELIAGGMTGPVNEMQSSFLNTIRANVDRMNTIVSDLNDLTKIQVGALRLEFKSISVPEAVDEVVRTLQKLLDEKRQTLTLDLPPDLPRIWADPLRLSQILTNLVSNANKYTGEDGNILLSAEAWMPDEAAESNLRFVHIWVKDNGIGISEEDQDKIFQQYFRTDISKETASGTGLGLNISKSLVEFQGGRIWFESKRNEGSTFHIIIPAAESN
jgi:signal transduction histidine kinase